MPTMNKNYFLATLAILVGFVFLPQSGFLFADTPTPIVIFVEEKITIGDGNIAPSGNNIEESIGVIDEVSSTGSLIQESISINDEVSSTGSLIQESISVNDDVETEVSGGIPATATPQPKPTMKPTATMVPTATKKPTANMRSRSSRSRGTTTTRAPIIFSPGSKSGPAITPTPQATNKYGRAPVVTSKSSKQPVTSAASKQPEQQKAVTSKAPARRTFGNFFGFRSSSSKDDDKKTTTSRSSSSRSRFSLVGRATGEDETQSDGQGDMAEESTSGSCASTSAREGVSVLAMLMLPLVIVNRKRLGL